MKARSKCEGCLLRIFEEELELAGISGDEKGETVKKLRKHLAKNFSLENDPYSQLATGMEEIVRKAAGGRDYFKQLKDEMNSRARGICNGLKADSLEDSMKIALAGNALDLLHLEKNEAVSTAKKALQAPLDVDDRAEAVELINRHDGITYVADNAGEVFFDRFLVEELWRRGKKVRYVVRSAPMSNDATEDDAREAGIDKFAEIEKFDKYGYAAGKKHPLIISKGHAGWVTLSEGNPTDIIFILKVKRCDIIASSLGVKPGAGVVKVV